MIFIYSQGGYAREFARLVRLQNPNQELVFIDDAAGEGTIEYRAALDIKAGSEAGIVIGFAGGELRRKKTTRVLADGFALISVAAPTSVVGDNVEIGAGAILSDFSTITADARIGSSFHCNIYSYVAHDCVVGDYVSLAPRVSINGRVEI